MTDPSIKAMSQDTMPVPSEYSGALSKTFNKFTGFFGNSKTNDDENALRVFDDLARVSQSFMDCVERNAINFVLGISFFYFLLGQFVNQIASLRSLGRGIQGVQQIVRV